MNRWHLVGAGLAVLCWAAGAGCSGDASGSGDGSSAGAGGGGGSGASAGSGGSLPDCTQVECSAIGCGPGFRSEMRAGECCPVCVPEQGLCDNAANNCSVLKGCVESYTLTEYAPGCCACIPGGCEASCEEPVCGPGERLEVPPDGCCPVCIPAASSCEEGEAPCELIDCAPGYTPSSFDDDGCCSGCFVDPEFCAEEKEGYASFLTQQITELDALSCASHEDCEVVGLSNECQFDCGTGVNKSQATELQSRLASYAEDNCAHCPPSDAGCAAVELQPCCVMGQCRAESSCE